MYKYVSSVCKWRTNFVTLIILILILYGFLYNGRTEKFIKINNSAVEPKTVGLLTAKGYHSLKIDNNDVKSETVGIRTDSFKVRKPFEVHGDQLPVAFTFKDNKWTDSGLCKPYKSFENNKLFRLANFVTNAGKSKIVVHPPSDGISSIIIRYGAFEQQTINRVLSELKKSPGANLIDIGTNVGQHCIAASLIGRKVIALDASSSNIQHVCASADFLHKGSNITLVHNVVSAEHAKMPVRYGAKDTEFGTIHVDVDDMTSVLASKFKRSFYKPNTSEQDSVKLDDLLLLPNIKDFKDVFIKLDVEGHEHKVLLGGQLFFNQTMIRGVLMEWYWHKTRQTAEIIKSFMKQRNFRPYQMHPVKDRDLSNTNSNSWPQDVLWLPNK